MMPRDNDTGLHTRKRHPWGGGIDIVIKVYMFRASARALQLLPSSFPYGKAALLRKSLAQGFLDAPEGNPH